MAIKPSDLSFLPSRGDRHRILAELRASAIQVWVDLACRRAPARLITRHRACGQGTAEAFARFVRKHGGCVTVDIPRQSQIQAAFSDSMAASRRISSAATFSGLAPHALHSQ